jgi:hypothetical protein
LAFIRNEELRDGGCNTSRPHLRSVLCQPFEQNLTEYDTVVLNRGVHYRPDNFFREDMTHLMSILKQWQRSGGPSSNVEVQM